jgi:hypothetical protein
MKILIYRALTVKWHLDNVVRKKNYVYRDTHITTGANIDAFLYSMFLTKFTTDKVYICTIASGKQFLFYFSHFDKLLIMSYQKRKTIVKLKRIILKKYQNQLNQRERHWY